MQSRYWEWLEYRSTKRVSDYFSVDINMIDKDNVEYYINKEKKAE